MKILENQSLGKYTTIRIGGTAKRFLIPESVDELINLVLKESPEYFIGGGSNLLVADREFDTVVSLKEFNPILEFQGNGIFKVGASVRLQYLINNINEKGYGGIEYLYSVPGLVGGAVVMNAGRGRNYNQAISDYILSVDILRDGKVITLEKGECGFEYRKSVFKNSNALVLGCTLKFPVMDKTESEQRKRDRLDFCRKSQDTSKPNFGTVFCESNAGIMNLIKKRQLGKKVYFSGKTQNWLLNDGGDYDCAINAIKKVEMLHRLLLKKCIREVIVWE